MCAAAITKEPPGAKFKSCCEAADCTIAELTVETTFVARLVIRVCGAPAIGDPAGNGDDDALPTSEPSDCDPAAASALRLAPVDCADSAWVAEEIAERADSETACRGPVMFPSCGSGAFFALSTTC